MQTRRYNSKYLQYFVCASLTIPSDLKSRMNVASDILAALNGLLNKLAPDNYEATVVRICDIFKPITDDDMLRTAVQILVRKASSEPKYVQLYAQLVLTLSSCAPSVLNLIFDVVNSQFESPDKRILCGTARFVGELYLTGIMATARLLHIITTLLERKTQDSIEVVTHLMTAVGPRFEIEDTIMFQTTIDNIQVLSQDPSISLRVRFSVLNLIELRDNQWKPRRKADEVKVKANFSPTHIDNFASPKLTPSSSVEDSLINLASPSSDQDEIESLSENNIEYEVGQILEEFCDAREPLEVVEGYRQLRLKGATPTSLICYSFQVYAEAALANHIYYEKLWPQLIDDLFTVDDLRIAFDDISERMSELQSDFPHLPKAVRSFVTVWHSRWPQIAQPYMLL